MNTAAGAATAVCTLLACGALVALIIVSANAAGHERTRKGVCDLAVPVDFTTDLSVSSSSSSVASFSVSNLASTLPASEDSATTLSSSSSSLSLSSSDSTSDSSTTRVPLSGCYVASDYACWRAGGTWYHERESFCAELEAKRGAPPPSKRAAAAAPAVAPQLDAWAAVAGPNRAAAADAARKKVAATPAKRRAPSAVLHATKSFVARAHGT